VRIYVAGPMTGHPDYNYPAFHAAADRLRMDGHHVENPAENDNPGGAWADWMRLALAQVLQVDGIALLDGWESSPGARLEVHVGAHLGLAIAPVRDWIADSRLVRDAESHQTIGGVL